jgi:D-glycerate 3-kinase
MLRHSIQQPLIQWHDVAAAVAEFITAEQLPPSFEQLAQIYYLPLAQRIARDTQLAQDANSASRQARLVGINGAQGTGKSTLAALLKCILEAGANLTCAIVSIDDVYLTRAERAELAQTIHPLLLTRGVPGSHDLELALEILEQLVDSHIVGTPDTIAIPRFNKAVDDRWPKGQWSNQQAPVDVVLFEGWCVAARPQLEDELIEPINALEAHEDSQGIWRGYVNNCLASSYQTLFARLNCLVMIKAPSMAAVAQWRWLQEQKLIAAQATKLNDPAPTQLMNEVQIQRFIQHYERITRHILNEMPTRADLVFHLNLDHEIASVSGHWAQEFPFVVDGEQSL